MTVSSTTNRKTYAGDAVTTSFGTSPVVFFESSELEVRVVVDATGASTLLVENTHYTVTGGDGTTGTIDTTGGASPYGAVASLSTLVILRVLPLTQGADLINNDASDAEVMEDALDRLVMILQQFDEQFDRSLLLPVESSLAELTLPAPAAGYLLGWNDTEDGLENKLVVDLSLVTISAFIGTLLEASTAASTRALLLIETKSTVASSATPDIWTGTGHLIDYTGTVTSTGLAAAPQAGAARELLCAGASIFTNGANYVVAGGNFTSAAGDRVLVIAETTTKFRLYPIKADGTPVVASTVALPRSYLAGAGIANGTDATNDINVAVGSARDSTNAVNIAIAAMAGKQLDANWAPGAAAGMRNSAAAIANTTYDIYAVSKADGTQDIYAYNAATSTTIATVIAALQAETGGASYLYARRIGSIIRAGGAIAVFSQNGDEFLRSVSLIEVNGATPNSAAAQTLTLAGVPVGRKVGAMLTGSMTGGTGTTNQLLITSLDQSDQAASVTAAPLFDSPTYNVGSQAFPVYKTVRTNTSAQIRYRLLAAVADTAVYIASHGWIDRRGKDD